MSIYQDLVESHGFTHAYNSVMRFVATLKRRAPGRFAVLEFLPGEESRLHEEDFRALGGCARCVVVAI